MLNFNEHLNLQVTTRSMFKREFKIFQKTIETQNNLKLCLKMYRDIHVYNLRILTRRIERQFIAFKRQGRESRILKTHPIHVKFGEEKDKENDNKQKL